MHAASGDLACNPGMFPDGESNRNLWVRRPALNPLNHISHGEIKVNFEGTLLKPYKTKEIKGEHLITTGEKVLEKWNSSSHTGNTRTISIKKKPQKNPTQILIYVLKYIVGNSFINVPNSSESMELVKTLLLFLVL